MKNVETRKWSVYYFSSTYIKGEGTGICVDIKEKINTELQKKDYRFFVSRCKIGKGFCLKERVGI